MSENGWKYATQNEPVHGRSYDIELKQRRGMSNESTATEVEQDAVYDETARCFRTKHQTIMLYAVSRFRELTAGRTPEAQSYRPWRPR